MGTIKIRRIPEMSPQPFGGRGPRYCSHISKELADRRLSMKKAMYAFLISLLFLNSCAAPLEITNGRGYSSTLDISMELVSDENWDFLELTEGKLPRLTHNSNLMNIRETAIFNGDPRILINLPWGYKKFKKIKNTLIFFHRDSPNYKFQIYKVSHDKELIFAQKKLSKNMSPEQIGSLVEKNVLSNKYAINATILSNQPTQVDGKPGYKLVFTYKTKEGLKYKVMDYGFHHEEWFYSLVFVAPERHYFEKYLDEFEKLAASFRLGRLVVRK
jgi:PsbP